MSKQSESDQSETDIVVSSVCWRWPCEINFLHWLSTSFLLFFYAACLVFIHRTGSSLFVLVTLISATSLIFREKIPSSFFCRWNVISFLTIGIFHLTVINSASKTSFAELFVAAFVIVTTFTTLFCEEWPLFLKPDDIKKLKSPEQLNILLIISTNIVSVYLLVFLFISPDIEANFRSYFWLCFGIIVSLIRPLSFFKLLLIRRFKGPLDLPSLLLGFWFFRKELFMFLNLLI